MLTAEELDRLEAVARAATPGPWHQGSGDHFARDVRSSAGDSMAWCGMFPARAAAANARHIATCNPQTILALVEMARRAQAAETELDGLRERGADHIAELTELLAAERIRAGAAEQLATALQEQLHELLDGAQDRARVAAGLAEFNRWRRDGDGPQPDPREIGELIDKAVQLLGGGNG